MMLLTLIFKLLADPVSATKVATAGTGMTREALRVCHRESRCEAIGKHTIDASSAAPMYKRATTAGVLLSWCPWHREPVGVTGPHGLSYEYTLQALPRWQRCIPPKVFALPIVSAWAWLKRQEWRCERYGACNRRARRRLDAGARNWDRRNGDES